MSESASSRTSKKSDPAWAYANQELVGNKLENRCIFCSKLIKGGGIHRVKEHLAHVKGNVSKCPKVPPNVQHEMKKNIEEHTSEKTRRKAVEKEIGNFGQDYDYEDLGSGDEDTSEVQVSKRGKRPMGASQSRTGGGIPSIDKFFPPRTTPGSQPTIKSVLASEAAKKRADMAFARWMYSFGLPFNAMNSYYFQPMLDAVSCISGGYKGPSYHDVRTNLLKENVKEVKEYIEEFRLVWASHGCSVMADGWKDNRGRQLINFMVYCYKGTIFLKSVDATNIIKTGQALFELFKDVIEDVGPENVLQFITDNAANYALAGKKLQEVYPTIFWTSCAAHCIDLMLEEIGKREEVADIVSKSQNITKFIYNHSFVLNLMRKHTKRELVRPAITRVATNFLTIQSMLREKEGLQAMMTSPTWISSVWSTKPNGVYMSNAILDRSFWSSMEHIFKVSEPLVRVLRLVDGETSPVMGCIYEAMDKAKETIAKSLRNRESQYDPYWTIIDDRWDRQLHRPIHAAAYFLNPTYFYKKDSFSTHPEVRQGLHTLIEMQFPEGAMQIKLGKQMSLYENGSGEFGRPYAVNTRHSISPAEWWQKFGIHTPELTRFAVRILSQTCSSSGCERNWSVFARIHTDARNRLEHKRLNDLVFVQYNLGLRQRIMQKPINLDPIDLDSIDTVKEWVVESEDPILDDERINLDIDNWMEMDDPPVQEGPTDDYGGETREVLEGEEEANIGGEDHEEDY